MRRSILIRDTVSLMTVKRIFVNGYGAIGSRISAFLKDDHEIELVGVGKYTADASVKMAISRGIGVYVPEGRMESFESGAVSGSIESALDNCDLVIDASPAGTGYHNKVSLYEPRGLKAIYQGGETIYGEHAVSDLLFNSQFNYDDAADRDHVIQGSCNVTGIGRILSPLRERYGARIRRVDVTLIRRWADIEQVDKKVPDTVEMAQNPHHGEDVKAYLGSKIPLFVRAVKVPTRQMHLHIVDVRFDGTAPDPGEVHDTFAGADGVATLWTASGTADVRRFADMMEFSFKDTNMIHIHANMTASRGDTVQIMYSDDQTGIVIPENHLLMQAMLFRRPYDTARSHTEEVFHMEEKRQQLEEHFACS